VPSSTQVKLERLKAQALKAAVQDNADVMANRLPAPLRPRRRLLHACARRAWLLALPFGILLASGAIADRSLHLEAVPSAASLAHVDEVLESDPERTRGPEWDPAAMARPLGAGVLALGVHRVVIDAGHGGVNIGAKSESGLVEKDLTLDLATRVRHLLTARGVDVVMTRTGDETLSLKERAATANASRGDIFVSIHLNVLAPATARGIETYYLGPGDDPEHDAIAAVENQHSGYSLADMRSLLDRIYADARRDESERLARVVQRALVRRLQAIEPAIKDRGVKTAPFIVLVATEMPAILAEVSCLSHAEEAERLGTPAYRQTIAESLASGIQAFIDDKNKHL
jgi:N-acetylmuramoyl-L-alanine amidase